MLLLGLLLIFAAVFILFLALVRFKWEDRPTLNIETNPADNIIMPANVSRKTGPFNIIFSILRSVAMINKPLSIGPLGRRISKDLAMARIPMTADEFLLIKEILLMASFWAVFTFIPAKSDFFVFGLLVSAGVGYYMPEFWLKSQYKKVKDLIVRDLPDTVDLLGLCVNAGLDFMMALKYVVEKSSPSVLIDEFKNMMQEISVGKPRRDALRDLSRKYELPDLSTFARTLIQADRMGTSVSDALNILSEDMREARFRRGEIMAMKAPMKMLIPLLLFIFPVVAILVAGPIFIDFFQNNPLHNLGR